MIGLKRIARALATVGASPMILQFWLMGWVVGRDRALQNSSQALSLIPGLIGQYVRRAFLSHAIEHCDPSSTVEFGTLFSKAGARLGENVYIGPMCHIGLASIGRDTLIAAGVHVPSGARIHGTDDPDRPIREQAGEVGRVRIGEGCWIGSGAVVMADVGDRTIVGAGSVVTKPLPADSVAAGVPAVVKRSRVAGGTVPESPGSC